MTSRMKPFVFATLQLPQTILCISKALKDNGTSHWLAPELDAMRNSNSAIGVGNLDKSYWKQIHSIHPVSHYPKDPTSSSTEIRTTFQDSTITYEPYMLGQTTPFPQSIKGFHTQRFKFKLNREPPILSLHHG
ncbi:hypothetical protein Tco_0194912 [Tanacetum coccineum]